MSNSMKLLARILLILALMIIGAWLVGQQALPEFAAGIAVYAVYFLIGIVLASTANPKFTKAKNKAVYVIPILIFAVIGALSMLYAPLRAEAWPFGIGAYLLNFSNLSWSIVGFFLSLSFR